MSLLAWSKQTRDAIRGLFDSSGVAPNAAGNMLEMQRYLIANPPASIPPTRQGLWLPPRFSTPADLTVPSGTVQLTETYNYFNNLTIAAGASLKAKAGGSVIVVEGTLTIAAGGAIHADALGGKGGLGGNLAAGQGGYGGGFWNYAVENSASDQVKRSRGGFVHQGTFGASEPYTVANLIFASMGDGQGLNNKINWPHDSYGLPFQNSSFTPSLPKLSEMGWALVGPLLEFMAMRPGEDATYGAIGGGGGGGGAGLPAANPQWPTGGYTGCKGANGSTRGIGGGGGSGIGGGGRGSTIYVDTGAGGQGGNGGRGGGVVVTFAKKVNNAGRISADGENGLPGTGTNAGGGGGGGGGAAVLVYEQVEGSGAGLVRALPGTGGASVGACWGSSAGGTGLAFALRVRSGW